MVAVARILKEKGYKVLVYCYDQADFYADLLEEKGIPIIWETELTNYLKRLFNIRSFVRNGCFDAVISFLPTCNFLNDFAAIGGKKWKVITGERSSRESTFKSIRGKFFGWFQRYTDNIVCNSVNACDLWRCHYPKYVDKLVVIYNCVQIPSINSKYTPKTNDKLHVVVAATYQFLKNPLGLVEALVLMADEERKWLVIDWYGRKEMSRGDTRAYDETAKAIEKKGLMEVLKLHSDTKEIADKMNQADVVMLLSKFEGLPNVICEGMTIGKPIIMTRVSDYQILIDESNGFLCDWNKPESIKEAILKMTALSKDQLQIMGQHSKEKASILFSKEVISQNWETIIK